MVDLPKYPRTLHVGDSGGTASRHRVEWDELRGVHLVIEEKIDGSHAGILFDADADLVIFSRNTEIPLNTSDRALRPLVQSAHAHVDALWEVLGDRFVLYGEWAYATHTIFYDALPAYFLEDDLYDRAADCFLDTPSRAARLMNLPEPFRHSVPVLHEGPVEDLADLRALVQPSRFKTEDWKTRLGDDDAIEGLDDGLDAEGLYVKAEERGRVLGRYKWVRPSFLETIRVAGQHWRGRRLLQNVLDEAL